MRARNANVEPAQQLLVGGGRRAASVPNLVEDGRRRAQVIGKRRQLHARFATEFGGGSPRTRIEHAALFEFARDRPQPFADRLGPQAIGRELRRGPAMVVCGGFTDPEDRLIAGACGAPQTADAHHDQHHHGGKNHHDQEEPESVPGCVSGARVEQLLQPLEQPPEAAVEQRRVVSVVAAFRQLCARRRLRAAARHRIWNSRSGRKPTPRCRAHAPAHHAPARHA